jgi:hypothetical protein
MMFLIKMDLWITGRRCCIIKSSVKSLAVFQAGEDEDLMDDSKNRDFKEGQSEGGRIYLQPDSSSVSCRRGSTQEDFSLWHGLLLSTWRMGRDTG